jgi:hypothetical protein
MNVDVLPELIVILKTDNIIAIREAVDSIGFLCFYNRVSYSESILNDLILCFNRYINNDIIRWKIVRAFEIFNSTTVIDILTNIKEIDSKLVIKNEAKRSLNIIKNRLTNYNESLC